LIFSCGTGVIVDPEAVIEVLQLVFRVRPFSCGTAGAARFGDCISNLND